MKVLHRQEPTNLYQCISVITLLGLLYTEQLGPGNRVHWYTETIHFCYRTRAVVYSLLLLLLL